MFNYKTTPYKHQEKALLDSHDKPNWALFMEMGCGKSKVLIDNAAWLYENKDLTTLVIIAPKGVYRNWVLKEIPAHMPDHIPHKVFTWYTQTNKKKEQELWEAVRYTDGLRILVMNIEAFASAKAMRFLNDKFLRRDVSMIAIDESTTIKNPKAKRTKAMIGLRQKFTYARILTGSPVTQSPLDLYSQCAFLDEGLLGFHNFYAFQARYAITRRQKMGTHSFDMIVGYRNLKELADKLKKFSSRVLKSECLDLPDKTYTIRHVAMTPEQRRHYESIKHTALTIIGDDMVTAPQAMTQLLRLQQVLSGYLPVEEDKYEKFETNRIKTLLEVLNEITGKVIIWARFVEDIRQIEDALKEKYGDNSTGSYYGATKDEDREQLVQDFQDLDSPVRFFIGNPQTAGYGLTLTSANNVVYYSNNFNLENRWQSEDRCHRIGQNNPVTYVDLVVEDSVDEHIARVLQDKIELASQALGEQMRQWLQVKEKVRI